MALGHKGHHECGARWTDAWWWVVFRVTLLNPVGLSVPFYPRVPRWLSLTGGGSRRPGIRKQHFFFERIVIKIVFMEGEVMVPLVKHLLQ